MFHLLSYVLVVPLTAQIFIIIKLRRNNVNCPLELSREKSSFLKPVIFQSVKEMKLQT
jgi:hypothetical protein